VSSSLGFKYASITSDVQYDTDFDFPSEPREHSRDCGDNYCLDYGWDPFVFSITFFGVERRRHYNALNRYVFKPLSDLQLISVGLSYDFIVDYFRYDLKNMPSQSAEIYHLAFKHMEQDDNDLPKEIENLNNMLIHHDNLISKTAADIIKITKTTSSISYESPVKFGVVYDYERVYMFLSRVWISCMDGKNIIECLENYIKNATPRADNGYFHFDGLPVAQGDEKELNTVRDVLYNILKNKEIIKNISDLKASTKTLNDQIKKIKEMVKPIADSIDEDLYSTRIKGCCTNLTVLRKI